ncbi:MAG: tetratricopeptide repeat protein [Planctomycetota bacterium]|nr:tetratricopeptide repeat protein [Planctomycetota bacterium]
MLKFNYFTNLGLATLVVVPAVTLGTSQNESLEQTLKRTLHALDQLAAIEQRLNSGDATAVPAALAACELPLPTPPDRPQARDELLETLRGDVARLEGEIELVESGSGASTTRMKPSTNDKVQDTDLPAPPAATTGLDDAARRLLGARTSLPVTTPATQPSTANTTRPAPSSARTFETDGYAADTLKLGRALYRQSRYAEALTTFEQRREDAECSYWRARTLEKLGRDADAIKAYGEVIELKDAGAHADRAKEDLEFLQWRLSFEKARPAAKETKQP